MVALKLMMIDIFAQREAESPGADRVMCGNSNLRAAHLGPDYSRRNSGVTLA